MCKQFDPSGLRHDAPSVVAGEHRRALAQPGSAGAEERVDEQPGGIPNRAHLSRESWDVSMPASADPVISVRIPAFPSFPTSTIGLLLFPASGVPIPEINSIHRVPDNLHWFKQISSRPLSSTLPPNSHLLTPLYTPSTSHTSPENGLAYSHYFCLTVAVPRVRGLVFYISARAQRHHQRISGARLGDPTARESGTRIVGDGIQQDNSVYNLVASKEEHGSTAGPLLVTPYPYPSTPHPYRSTGLYRTPQTRGSAKSDAVQLLQTRH
ncbi:hypothetical protein C8R45DRAFT_1123751 [Mycena sanguinolenta]|nr:hypothetical protein C8R45DRAFT_1123751 [Mycena sanguinolenta]